jgi:hypothetical protein
MKLGMTETDRQALNALTLLQAACQSFSGKYLSRQLKPVVTPELICLIVDMFRSSSCLATSGVVVVWSKRGQGNRPGGGGWSRREIKSRSDPLISVNVTPYTALRDAP